MKGREVPGKLCSSLSSPLQFSYVLAGNRFFWEGWTPGECWWVVGANYHCLGSLEMSSHQQKRLEFKM